MWIACERGSRSVVPWDDLVEDTRIVQHANRIPIHTRDEVAITRPLKQVNVTRRPTEVDYPHRQGSCRVLSHRDPLQIGRT